jgi:hypothetical protein
MDEGRISSLTEDDKNEENEDNSADEAGDACRSGGSDDVNKDGHASVELDTLVTANGDSHKSSYSFNLV